MPNVQSDRPPRTITRVAVRKLFGVFDYSLSLEEPADHEGLLILYGENGTGKTTLLKLVYHLLNPEPASGHRSFVRTVPFLEFTVELGPGTYVTAKRKDAGSGAFTMVIVLSGKEIAKHKFYHEGKDLISDVGESGYSRYLSAGGQVIFSGFFEPDSDAKHRAFCEQLASLGSQLRFLSDDRRVLEEEDIEDYEQRLRRMRRYARERPDLQPDDQPPTPIQLAVRRAEEWIRRQSLGAADRGSMSANQIYTDVVEGIVGIGVEADDRSEQSFEGLRSQVRSVAKRSDAFARFGLTAQIQTTRMEAALDRATQGARSTIQRILKPYLDGLTARLDEQQAIQQLLTTLVDHVNTTFFRLGTKELRYKLGRGFEVVTKAGNRLELTQLSSGERQLLLLLCTIVASHDKPTIFLIDEPELSLNVKWQRALLGAMLDCMRGTQSQLVVASHSLELISRYRRSVIRLDATDAAE